MAIADPITTDAKVKWQYETFPYPERDPADEAKRLMRTHHDQLESLNHYCFRGRRDFRHGFRALVAGGGTGDATVYLAQQLAGTDAAIVHLDVSAASIDVARRRTRQRGLEQDVSWIEGSLFDLPSFGLEPFDYVNCSGVLHHLDDPNEGLAALVSVLKDDGALGLMLYGRYGRLGVYPMQELMRLINRGEQHPQEKVNNAKETFAALPISNVLKRMAGAMPDDGSMNDTEFYDMFLHAKDRPFSVPEVYELLDSAGLHLIEFCSKNRALLDPRIAFPSGRLHERVSRLPRREQQAAAELFWGAVVRYDFWASRRSNTIADPRHPDNVPLFPTCARLIGAQQSLLAAADAPGESWKYSILGPLQTRISLQIALNDVSRRLVRLIDGRRTTGEIVGAIAAELAPRLSVDEVWHLCHEALRSLQGFDLVLLRHVSAPPMP